MDTQTQEKLKLIDNAIQIGMNDERIAKSNVMSDLKFLFQLVREQDEQLTSHAPEGHNYTNAEHVSCLFENEKLKTQLTEQEETISELSSIYEMQYGALNQQLREQLTKYERVIEVAQEIAYIQPVYEAGRHTLYQLYESDIKPLRDALDSLKA